MAIETTYICDCCGAKNKDNNLDTLMVPAHVNPFDKEILIEADGMQACDSCRNAVANFIGKLCRHPEPGIGD